MVEEMTTEKLSPEAKAEVKALRESTKKGFDLRARLEGRGLRKGSIVLFLDEESELGRELGYAYDRKDQFGNVLGRARQGILGEIDALQTQLGEAEEAYTEAVQVEKTMETKPKDRATREDIEAIEHDISILELERDAMVAKLGETGLTIRMRAVPPVIQKSTRRLAKETLKIKGKVPDDEEVQEAFNDAIAAHLMALTITEIIDNETGDSKVKVTYEDAKDLIDFLPPGQFQRLDNKLGEVQFADAISRTIEGQEDFS